VIETVVTELRDHRPIENAIVPEAAGGLPQSPGLYAGGSASI
jgi:hypothetical protein